MTEERNSSFMVYVFATSSHTDFWKGALEVSNSPNLQMWGFLPEREIRSSSGGENYLDWIFFTRPARPSSTTTTGTPFARKVVSPYPHP